MEVNKGWISLHRKFEDNFLWKERRVFSKAEAWIDILLQVNHSDEQVLIGNHLIKVKRGQSIKSLETWQKRWNWKGKKQVRDFLLLLRSQSMLQYESVTKSIRITVCNYSTYQDTIYAKETQNKRKVNAKETHRKPNNNDNNENNDNNINKGTKKTDFLDEIIKVFSAKYYLSRNVEYISNGKDRSAVGKLLSVYKKKNVSDSTETIKDFDIFFSQCLNIKDEWYYNNMSLPIINSKINEIRNILRKTNVTSQEIRTAVNNNFGE